MAPDPTRADAVDRLMKAALRGRVPGGGEPPTPACLDAETLAAWSEGALTDQESRLVEVHLASCGRCQAIAAAFAESEPAAAATVVAFPRRTWRWLVPLVASAAAAVVVIYVNSPGRRQPVTLDAPTSTVARSDAPPPAAPPLPPAQAPPPSVSAPVDKFAESKLQRQESRSPSNVATPKLEAPRATTTPARPQAAPIAPPAAFPTTPPPPATSTISGLPVVTASPPPPPPPPPSAQGAVPPTTPPAGAVAGQGQAGSVFRQSTVTAASELVDTRAVIAEFSSGDPQADQQRPAAAGGGGGGGRGGGGAGAGRGGAARGSTVSGLPQSAINVTLDGVTITVVRWRILASGAVERSINNATTWSPIAITPPARITAGTAPSVPVCWLAGREGVVLRTIDGIKFERVTSPDPGDFVSVQAVDDQQAAVRTSDGRIFSTRDGGKTWRAGGYQPPFRTLNPEL